jgi:hypothetical protein
LPTIAILFYYYQGFTDAPVENNPEAQIMQKGSGMKKSFLLLVLALILTISCGDANDDNDESGNEADDADDDDVSSADDDDDDDIDEGLGWPIDAILNEDGSLLVLYAANSETDPGINSALVWFDDARKPIRQIEAGLDFPHTLDVFGGDILISDSMNQRLVIVSASGDEVEEINFEDWENDTVWPNDADFTPDGDIIFSDLFGMTINKITPDGELIWQRRPIAGTPDNPAPLDDEIHDPDELPNGNLIFCLSRSGVVVEINENDEVVWEYNEDLLWPKSVQRLESGSTMITDAGHIVEVDPNGSIIWEYVFPFGGGMNAERLSDGNTLTGTNHVALIAPDGTIIWELDPAFNNKRGLAVKPNHRLEMLRSIGYLN